MTAIVGLSDDTRGTFGPMNSGEYSRIRTVAACSTLDRERKLVLRQTRRGYEIYANGDAIPTRLKTWPETRRALMGFGIPHDRVEEISGRLVEGMGVIVRRPALGGVAR
jgi:hypothetical protein